MKYDLETFTVEAGKTIEIIFENPDQMQHNLIISQPGTLEKVGAAADQIARDPEGSQKQYVPGIDEVMLATKLLNPEETIRIRFTAPDNPGDYPYVCTFPGHWRLMQGTMQVVTSGTASIR
jgi:azurin